MKPPQIKRKTFIQWLENQPDDRKFDYMNTDNCLICHFFREVHGVEVSAGGNQYRMQGQQDYEPLPEWLNYDIVKGGAVYHACFSGLRWLKNFLSNQQP